jgi:hypothetical protein
MMAKFGNCGLLQRSDAEMGLLHQNKSNSKYFEKAV